MVENILTFLPIKNKISSIRGKEYASFIVTLFSLRKSMHILHLFSSILMASIFLLSKSKFLNFFLIILGTSLSIFFIIICLSSFIVTTLFSVCNSSSLELELLSTIFSSSLYVSSLFIKQNNIESLFNSSFIFPSSIVNLPLELSSSVLVLNDFILTKL
eukprot:jgi/Orpsp1_1/1175313/evm.model.c7180000053383.1